MNSDNKPTARFLQARISALSSTLIKRLENIFAAALQATEEPPSASVTGPLPPSYVQTAAEQLSLDVESSALVRAAEEIMMLTRSMKDLWLFGGLNTIPDGNKEDAEKESTMGHDQRVVAEAVTRYLGGGAVNGTASQPSEDHSQNME